MWAQAIYEAVLPRQSGDNIPRTPPGILVAVADRLDSLVGLTAAGAAPSASADPYGLRRAAYGMLEALVGNGVRLDLPAAVAAAAELLPIPAGAAAQVLGCCSC
jgi:glycyl-tRNA synthetase